MLFPSIALFSCVIASAEAHFMSQVHFTGNPYEVQVLNVTRPNITSATDAIIRITRSAVCGSDLHSYRGFSPPVGPVGHEAVGIVDEIGSAVTAVDVGDFVIIPSSATNGYWQQVPQAEEFFAGLQAQYARVPVADANLIRVPPTNGTMTPEMERDYLLIGDVWPTSWQSLDRSGFRAGDVIAIWGAGPVGLLSAYSAQLRGASRVYIIDHVQERLDRAASIGAIPINFVTQNVTEALLAAEPRGIPRLVDAVGFEALTANLTVDSNIVVRQMVAVSQLDGGIGLGGVYIDLPQTESNPRAAEVNTDMTFDVNTYFFNRLVMKGGALEPRASASQLVSLVASGVAHPSRLLFSSEISIDQVSEYYARFERWEETKVFIYFP